MNDQNTDINPGASVEPVIPSTPVAPQPPSKPSLLAQISSKIPPKVKEGFSKFYANKKIFWPVTVIFGLLFLTIFLGLLFGSRDRGQSITKNISTPTPESQENITQENPGGTETKLEQLKNQINAFDVNQKRLQPPSVNFKVNF